MIGALIALWAAPFSAGLATSQGTEGRVVEDHSGNSLASVEVRVRRTGAARLVADLETAPDGRFHLPELPAGEYSIDLTKPNYIGATLRFNGVIPPTLMVRLVRCGAILGRISDPEGQPVRGAIVHAMPKPPQGGPPRPFAALAPGSYSLVDENGQYRLFYLPPGQYLAAVSYGASSMALGMTGSAPVNPRIGSGVILYPNSTQPRTFTVAGGEEYRDVDFNLTSGAFYSVSGNVDVPPGGPPYARFWLALAPVDRPSLAAAATQAEPDGSFRFEGVAPGSYHLLASGPSTGRNARGAALPPEPYFARSHVEVAGQNLEGVAVSPQKGQTAAFMMRGGKEAKGACPEEAQFTLTPLEDWAAVLDRSASVTGSKEQVLRDLAPARFRVQLAGLGDRCFQLTEVTLDLAQPPGVEPVTIPVAAAGSIRGKLVGTARPTDYAVALLTSDPESGEQAIQVAFPDPEARFTFNALRPGKYHLVAQPANTPKARWVSDPARMPEIEIPGGSPTQLELPVLPAKEGGQP